MSVQQKQRKVLPCHFLPAYRRMASTAPNVHFTHLELFLQYRGRKQICGLTCRYSVPIVTLKIHFPLVTHTAMSNVSLHLIYMQQVLLSRFRNFSAIPPVSFYAGLLDAAISTALLVYGAYRYIMNPAEIISVYHSGTRLNKLLT